MVRFTYNRHLVKTTSVLIAYLKIRQNNINFKINSIHKTSGNEADYLLQSM